MAPVLSVAEKKVAYMQNKGTFRKIKEYVEKKKLTLNIKKSI